jgi:hypothetical protein
MTHRTRVVAAMATLAAIAVASFAAPSGANAEDAPLSYIVSPAVYKILSENDDYRVILATWPPGTKDAFHSHPVSFVSYALTDCSRRFHFPDGKSNDAAIKKGQVFLQDPVPSHSFENIGTTTCEILIVEKKR